MSNRSIFAAVFITEFALLMVEMAAFKITVSYFGSTMPVWANIIGVIMIGSALGYYGGGVSTAQWGINQTVFFLTIITAGVFIAFTPLLSFAVGDVIASRSAISISSLLYTLLLFGIPAFLIELIPPFAVYLKNKAVETAGATTGSLYGCAAVGGLAGLLFATFVTLPLAGVKETFFVAGGSLIIFGLCHICRKTNDAS
ncbi:fused MFS/spermidine synthase [Candidatus Uhrbacteria bacterium]|nr:fused MFS/spermidine synthase [Candidatus Uhrbacteria bacterium]